MSERTFTKEEIDSFLATAHLCDQSGWQESYRLGFHQGIVAVMCAFDDYRRVQKDE